MKPLSRQGTLVDCMISVSAADDIRARSLPDLNRLRPCTRREDTRPSDNCDLKAFAVSTRN